MQDPYRDAHEPAVRTCVLIMGGIGFATGFFGPMVFDPT